MWLVTYFLIKIIHKITEEMQNLNLDFRKSVKDYFTKYGTKVEIHHGG